MPARSLPGAVLTVAALLLTSPARASLTTDLQGLAAGLSGVHAQLAGTSIDSLGACAEIGTLNTSLEDYVASASAISAGLSAPLTLTSADLTSLDELSGLVRSMSQEAIRLSLEVRTVDDVYDLVEYRAALAAMLRLSTDIGTMADRILEMADRILAMADNIGAMADRILVTQQLQNTNVALVQAALLTTQQNLVAFTGSVSTIGYNLTLGQLKLDTRALSDLFAGTALSSEHMDTQLAQLAAATQLVLNETIGLYTTMTAASQMASHYVDGDTLTLMGDLTVLHRALALSLEAYAAAVETLAPVTDNAVLRDATAAMLQLTADIGVMSNRIVQMSDRIVVMADNVGVMAGRITQTQDLQQQNVVLTQSSLLTAQTVAFDAIASYGL